MRRMKIIAVIIGIAVALSGCGRSGGRKPADKGPAEVELVMWLVGSEAQAQAINALAEDFYAETKIKARCESIAWGDAHSKYLTSIAGGGAPDIGTMGLTWGTEFGSLGAVVDLKAAYPEEMQEIKNMVFTGMWESIEYKGHVFGIPFDMTEHILYYRSDIIPEPPTTWADLTSLLTRLNQENMGMIFDWGSMSWIGYSPFLWQAGGDYYDAAFSEVTVNSPEAVAALTFFLELYTRYRVPKTSIPVEQGMRSGEFPIAISGNWKIQGLTLGAPEIAGKWTIASLPTGPSDKKTAFLGGRTMGIFAQSKHKDEAWQFIKFLFRPDSQERLYEDAIKKQDAYLPPNLMSWDRLKMDAAFKDVLMRQARDAKGPPPIANWDTCTKFIDEAIQKVILQNADPKAELDKAKNELTKLLKAK